MLLRKTRACASIWIPGAIMHVFLKLALVLVIEMPTTGIVCREASGPPAVAAAVGEGRVV